MALRRRVWFGSGLSGLAQRYQCQQELSMAVSANLRPRLFLARICRRAFRDRPAANVSAASVSLCIKLVKLLGKSHKPVTCSVALQCQEYHVLRWQNLCPEDHREHGVGWTWLNSYGDWTIEIIREKDYFWLPVIERSNWLTYVICLIVFVMCFLHIIVMNLQGKLLREQSLFRSLTSPRLECEIFRFLMISGVIGTASSK